MTEGFQPRVRRALADPVLQQALDRNAERRRAAWASAFASLSDPAETRRRAAEIRRRSVEHLPRLLARFVEEAERRGIVVHRAATAADACGVILGLLRDRGVRRVIKAKSMVTEEIGLNRALAAAGVQAVETDLGEFIVQLRGEPPAHITAPAIHLRREEVARTFETHLGMRYTTDVEAITAAARRALRDDFLEAQAGISGVNFGVAETGMLCLVTNEGNGRMVTTLPPLHIAVMGAERVVETLADLSVMLDVLPRAGTGQRRTSYVSLLAGPRRASDPDGPRERHLVIVDGGRLGLRDSPLAESLACIRCGACLNACPIYQEIGGHAYGSVYPGPIGSVVSPGLWGTAAFGHLATASTLCGACRDACPVAIDLPAMLLHIRAARVDQGRPPFWMRAGVAFVASILASPTRFAVGLRLAAGVSRLMPARAGWIRRLPPPLNRWTTSRDFPAVASRPFRARWASLSAKVVEPAGGSTSSVPPRNQTPPVREPQDRRTRFVAAARDAGCVVIECARAQLADRIADALGREGVTEVLAWEEEPGEWGALFEGLKVQGIRILGNDLVPGGRAPKGSSSVGAGLTGAVAGLADAGTLVLPSGAGRPLSASLLPPIHLAVLEERNLYDSLEAWLASDGDRWLSQESTVALITGPSRTADIEMTLTIGVHGPGKVVVFVVR